ncbi:MAG: DUF6261 family protein [Tannerellaceae bacterium]|jgi:hypothetical protein|nr:DUF6261 family protein [Tannerellaceae bacterium]
MKIIRFNQNYLRNEEWFEFHTDFRNSVDTYGQGKLGIVDLYRSHGTTYDIADRILQTLRKSYYTVQIKDAGKARVEAFRNLQSVIKSFKGYPVASKSDAAMHLYNLVASYAKNITRGSYAQTSASIYNLLGDLQEDKYEDDLDLLELSDWVDVLQKAEKAFLAIMEKRTEESVDKPKENMITVRRQLDALYIDMATVIDAALIAAGLGGDVAVDPESLDLSDHQSGEKFDPLYHGNIPYNFVIFWNEIVKKYRNLASRHTGKNNKDKNPDIAE